MGKVFVIMLLSSIMTLLFKDPSVAVTALTNGSYDAVLLAMQLVALYAFWLGFFAILEKTGISGALAKLLRPVVRFLFPGAEKNTAKFITLNMSANIIGLGNAATPMAIEAIKSMDKGDEKASINMIMLLVISSTSLQLLPTTVIGMRATNGSANPSEFLLACTVATVCSTLIGIFLVKMLHLFRVTVGKKIAAKRALKRENRAAKRAARKTHGESAPVRAAAHGRAKENRTL